jgi:ankyrin repeat protein
LKIHDFARDGNVAGVAAELAAGVDIDCLEICSERTALHIVCALPDASLTTLQFLVQQGAKITPQVLEAAVQSGSIDTLAYLVKSGAGIVYVKEGGCDSLTLAAYGRTAPNDFTLLPVLTWLIEHGVGVRGRSSYGESAIAIASRLGRFDAVRLLINCGADARQLEWTDLMYAVTLGTVGDVQELLEQGCALNARDHCNRTPWLLSLQAGDLAKVKLLLQAGSNRNDRGHCEQTPVQIAVESERHESLKWLIAEGFDVNATDEFGDTPLLSATEGNDPESVRILLSAGADPGKGNEYNKPIQAVYGVEILPMLLAAGEDFAQIGDEMRSALIGVKLPGDLRVTQKQYEAGRQPLFGRWNPQRMNVPFWRAMVRSDCNATRPK